MEKIDELMQLLKTVAPILMEWKTKEDEKQRSYEEERTESQREFEKWLKAKQAEEAQEAKDAEELKKHFYGGEKWRGNEPQRF